MKKLKLPTFLPEKWEIPLAWHCEHLERHQHLKPLKWCVLCHIGPGQILKTAVAKQPLWPIKSTNQIVWISGCLKIWYLPQILGGDSKLKSSIVPDIQVIFRYFPWFSHLCPLKITSNLGQLHHIRRSQLGHLLHVGAGDELHGRLAFQQPPAMAIQSWVATPVGNIWKITNSNQVADVAVWEKTRDPGKWKAQRSQKEPKWDHLNGCIRCPANWSIWWTSGHPSYDKFQSTHILVSLCRRPKTSHLYHMFVHLIVTKNTANIYTIHIC